MHTPENHPRENRDSVDPDFVSVAHARGFPIRNEIRGEDSATSRFLHFHSPIPPFDHVANQPEAKDHHRETEHHELRPSLLAHANPARKQGQAKKDDQKSDSNCAPRRTKLGSLARTLPGRVGTFALWASRRVERNRGLTIRTWL